MMLQTLPQAQKNVTEDLGNAIIKAFLTGIASAAGVALFNELFLKPSRRRR